MRLTAKAIRISYAKFNCNRLTTVQDLQDYVNASLIFGTHGVIHNYINVVWMCGQNLLEKVRL